MYVLVRYFAPFDKICLRRVDCMAPFSLSQRFRTSRYFCTFDAKKKQITPVPGHLCHKKSTALSAAGLEASAEESDGARYATRSLTRCTIKILWRGGQEKVPEVGWSAGGEIHSVPYKPIRNVPFFRVSFFSINS